MTDAAPLILTALMGAEDFAWADALRKAHFPPTRNFLSAHITLFHHLAPSLLGEADALLKDIAKSPPPPAQLSDVMNLGRGVAYRIHSPALMAMREDMADAFHGMLTPQDQARPRLHITVQNKVEPREAKALLVDLSRDFVPRPIKISGLALWYYRSGPWEGIKEYKFRG